MKRFAILLLLLLSGCTSVLLQHSTLATLHFTESSTPGEFIVSCVDMNSAFPIVGYQLTACEMGERSIYTLRLYGNLTNKAPHTNVRWDLSNGYHYVTLEIPDFRVETDQLFISDSAGNHLIPFWSEAQEQKYLEDESRRIEHFKTNGFVEIKT